MKKILHINSQFEIIWWMEKYIEIFYNSFSSFFDIKIFKFYKWKNNSNINNKNIFSLELNICKTFLCKAFDLFRISKSISSYCQKEKIEDSISHWDFCNIFNILSKLFWNRSKIIIIIHNSVDKKTIWIAGFIITKIIYRFADKIICVSKELEQDIKENFWIKKENIMTIYNPFDFNKIKEIKKEEIKNIKISKIINNWKINFCHIARLELYKKQDFLIECFSEYIKNINKNAQLFIIWDWNYKKELEKIINEKELEKNIYLLWYKNNIYKYLNKMNYFLFTSSWEWFWRTLIDSLSCNIPVLTFDYKYWAKEIIRNNDDLSKCKKIEIHENGILTPYIDKYSFIKWIDLMTKTNFDKEKIKSNIKKYNIENFTKKWDLILK